MKKKTSKKYYRRYDFQIVLFFIIFGAIAVSGFVWVLTPKQILPVYQPAMIDPKLVDESIQFVKKISYNCSIYNDKSKWTNHN